MRLFWLSWPQRLVKQAAVGDCGEDLAHAEGERERVEEEELSAELDDDQLLWRLCHTLKVQTDGPSATDL